jgi:hypothetical protein
VTETFNRDKRRATWLDSTGKGQAKLTDPAIYVAQSGSPWSLQIYARALLRQPGMSMRALPGGTLKLEKGDSLTVEGAGGAIQVTRYDLSGIRTDPEMMLLDAQGNLFASVWRTTTARRRASAMCAWLIPGPARSRRRSV